MLIKALAADHKQALEMTFAERSRVPASSIWFAGFWKQLHVLLSSLFLQPVSKSQMTCVKRVSEACVPPVYEPCWKTAFRRKDPCLRRGWVFQGIQDFLGQRAGGKSLTCFGFESINATWRSESNPQGRGLFLKAQTKRNGARLCVVSSNLSASPTTNPLCQTTHLPLLGQFILPCLIDQREEICKFS